MSGMTQTNSKPSAIGRRGFLGALLALPAAAKAWALASPTEGAISIPIASMPARLLKAGDIFTIQGCYSDLPNGRLQRFVVTGDVTSHA